MKMYTKLSDIGRRPKQKCGKLNDVAPCCAKNFQFSSENMMGSANFLAM